MEILKCCDKAITKHHASPILPNEIFQLELKITWTSLNVQKSI